MMETLKNFITLRKFKGYPQKANAISFLAFFFSIIFYISIFLMFNIQPSTIINTTKFWFFISNTLILIIAADFGAFSSSKEHDIYEEYAKKTQQARTDSFLETHHMKFMEKTNPKPNMIMIKTEEKIKDVVVYEKAAAEEVKLDIVVIKHESQVINHEEKKKEAKCVRSNSDKAIMVENEERKIVLQRSKSEKDETEVEDQSELSTISIEELNKRVEEFIQRCNRQIRLQAPRNGRKV